MRLKPVILAILFITSGIFYYSITANAIVDKTTVSVQRIIDGDTFEISSGQKVRLKGINTPEKGFPFSDDATAFLKNSIENKSIQLEIFGTDKYGRFLAYTFSQNKNVNEEIIKKGLATLYYYEQDNHYKKLKQAEEFARTNQLGIWKKSPNANCLELIQLKYKEQPTRCTNDEKLILKNHCNELNVTIKDDATHIYKEIIPKGIFTKSFSCIWNDAGDTLYISDDKGLLIFHRYN